MIILGGDSGTIGTETATTNVFVDKSFTSVLLAGANSNRACLTIVNTSNKSLFINYDNAATEDDIEIKKGDSKDIDCIKGAIYGIWKSGADEGAKIIETTFL